MSFRSRCTSLSRYLIILINVVIAIVALALIALALWIRFDVNFEHNLRINIQNVNVTPPAMNRIKEQIQTAILCAFYVIIGVSGASLACSMIGIVAAVIQNRRLYVFSMIFLVILVLLEIAIGIFVIVYQSNLRNGINVYTSLSFQYNTNDAASLMDRYSCCGDGTTNAYNQQCLQPGTQILRDCPTAVWERLSQHLMIAGLVLLGIIITKILLTAFNFIVILNHRYRTLVD